jgi:isoquinoline 1-oxidoreductase beta subunit
MSRAVETDVVNVSRRGFLKGLVAGGALVLGARFFPLPEAAGQDAEPWRPDHFLAIAPSGLVTIVAHRSEMGTGIRTSLPMVVADELEADWAKVELEQAIGDKKYGSQNTDGSRSIRNFFTKMRQVGASARAMLVAAAAAEWGVPAGECVARDHQVHHEGSGRKVGYGDLVAKARTLEAPAEPPLKDPKEWKFIGKDVVEDAGFQGIVRGSATFGMDLKLPGMKYAAIARSPVLGGKVKSVDDAAAKATPGVEAVVQLPPFKGPVHGFQALGGVAVIASNTWAAFRGAKALKVEWEGGPNAAFDSEAYEAELMATVTKPGKVVRSEGDVDGAFAKDGADTHAASYYVPMLAHASMEPPCALAHVTDDRCEAWAPTQNPQAAQETLMATLGIQDPSKVVVNVSLLGGGFGRKSKPDYVAEAALLSRELKAPVKVVWSREDDVRHDYYHSAGAVHVKASLDEKGRPTAWLQRSAFPSIFSTFAPGVTHGSDMEMMLGFTDVPYAVKNLRVENGPAKAHVRIGWLRSVSNIFHVFGTSSFADELAHKAGVDPLQYLLDLIGEDRLITFEDGVNYPNYSKPLEDYPIDTARLKNVLRLAARKSGWAKRKLAKGQGLGIAVHRSFLSYVANVVEVKVDPKTGKVSIPRVDVALDCGVVVNPDRVRAQMEGSAVFGASIALHGEITAKQGAIRQSNFHDYRVARITDAPQQVNVHLVESTELPTGVGEPGVPPFPPALCNAIFAATGKRIRRLPIQPKDLRQG